MQDLRQARYQILLINLLKEFIELNVNTDIKIKNLKNLAGLNIKIFIAFLDTQNLKINQSNTNACV